MLGIQDYSLYYVMKWELAINISFYIPKCVGCHAVKFCREYLTSEMSLQFCQAKKPNWSQLLQNVDWIAKLAYLADIFGILNELNISMQGRMNSCLTTADKIDGQKRKLKAWKTRVSKNCFDMFYNLSTTIADAAEELNVSSVQNVVSEHLTNLAHRFEIHFPVEEDTRKGTG